MNEHLPNIKTSKNESSVSWNALLRNKLKGAEEEKATQVSNDKLIEHGAIHREVSEQKSKVEKMKDKWDIMAATK